MSYILEKSKQNEYAALKLFDPEYKYASSIHCAYYSSVQLMIHILLQNGYSKEKIGTDTKNGSSHAYYITKTRELIEKKSSDDVKNFSEIKDLKAYRITSDYKDIQISYNDCKKAIEISNKVNRVLRKVFSIK